MTLLLFDQSAILRINFKQYISPVIMAKKNVVIERDLHMRTNSTPSEWKSMGYYSSACLNRRGTINESFKRASMHTDTKVKTTTIQKHTHLFSCYTKVAIITMLYYSEELLSYKDNVNMRSPKLIQIASLIGHILLKWSHVNSRVQHVFVNWRFVILIIYEANYQNIIILFYSINIVLHSSHWVLIIVLW